MTQVEFVNELIDMFVSNFVLKAKEENVKKIVKTEFYIDPLTHRQRRHGFYVLAYDVEGEEIGLATDWKIRNYKLDHEELQAFMNDIVKKRLDLTIAGELEPKYKTNKEVKEALDRLESYEPEPMYIKFVQERNETHV